ncbi:hypothetical protein PSAC2689_200007 [Paraburkholderia sacchari]|uniref:hypothetical protein n=1 Tax=Paraburkholderia sacchari TaxID=159450 RepID=UPI0039A61866
MTRSAFESKVLSALAGDDGQFADAAVRAVARAIMLAADGAEIRDLRVEHDARHGTYLTLVQFECGELRALVVRERVGHA